MKAWAGRRVARLVAITLAQKGTTCHLCGLAGADSADHDPPRSVLIASGVPDPDALVYLHPAHRYPCNVVRKDRPITNQLRAELLHRRLNHVAGRAFAPVSPRFLRPPSPAEGSPVRSLPEDSPENPQR